MAYTTTRTVFKPLSWLLHMLLLRCEAQLSSILSAWCKNIFCGQLQVQGFVPRVEADSSANVMLLMKGIV